MWRQVNKIFYLSKNPELFSSLDYILNIYKVTLKRKWMLSLKVGACHLCHPRDVRIIFPRCSKPSHSTIFNINLVKNCCHGKYGLVRYRGKNKNLKKWHLDICFLWVIRSLLRCLSSDQSRNIIGDVEMFAEN